MRLLKVLSVIALALCLTASAYAETQSVKVSGDLTTRGIFRNAYDLTSGPDEGLGTLGNVDSSNQSWFMSVAEVQVDADLTDNVQTVIRLVNQRDWNVYSRSITSTTSQAVNGRGGYTGNSDEFDVMLDLAYVQLKDFIYAPLTLTIGRQDLWFGKGFIVGLNQQNPGGNLSAPEYTAINSFDAIKAVLDYDPWTITGIYSKIYEDAIQANDDVDLAGVNVGYKFDSYKAEAEAYWFYKKDNSVKPLTSIRNGDDVHTFGIRGSFDPIDVVTLNGEYAYQGGQYVGSRLQNERRDRSAWALDVSGEWRVMNDKFTWKPKVGAEFIFYSGDRPTDNINNTGGTYTGWNPMYRGKFDSAIREFVGRYYATQKYPVDGTQTLSMRDASFTNQGQMIFMGSIQPMDSVFLKANYNIFWNQFAYFGNNNNSGNTKGQGIIGSEIDLSATWDYTEDVSFNLLYGVFLPGYIYGSQNSNDQATDLVGSVKVNF